MPQPLDPIGVGIYATGRAKSREIVVQSFSEHLAIIHTEREPIELSEGAYLIYARPSSQRVFDALYRELANGWANSRMHTVKILAEN